MRSIGTIAADASSRLRSASFERHRVVQRQPGARRAPQGRQMRADAQRDAQVVRERPHVETRRALERQRDVVVVEADDLEAMDGDAHGGGQGRAGGSGGRAGAQRRARALRSCDARRSSWPRRPAAAARTCRGTRRGRIQWLLARRRTAGATARRPARLRRRTCRSPRRTGRPLRTACSRRSGIARGASRVRGRAAARRWRPDRACPVWPIRRSPSTRRMRATTSWLVGPGGLSMTRRPSIRWCR